MSGSHPVFASASMRTDACIIIGGRALGNRIDRIQPLLASRRSFCIKLDVIRQLHNDKMLTYLLHML